MRSKLPVSNQKNVVKPSTGIQWSRVPRDRGTRLEDAVRRSHVAVAHQHLSIIGARLSAAPQGSTLALHPGQQWPQTQDAKAAHTNCLLPPQDLA